MSAARWAVSGSQRTNVRLALVEGAGRKAKRYDGEAGAS
jgi:hypothetical protein